MLILAIIGAGMFVGWIAQILLGRKSYKTDWTLALVAGVGGSFLGGLIASLLAGDGLAIRPSGLIGSFVGALAITAGWQWWTRRQAAEARAAGSHR